MSRKERMLKACDILMQNEDVIGTHIDARKRIVTVSIDQSKSFMSRYEPLIKYLWDVELGLGETIFKIGDDLYEWQGTENFNTTIYEIDIKYMERRGV